MAEEFAVRKKRFSVEQIVAVLKQAELGLPVADRIRQVAGSRRRRCKPVGRPGNRGGAAGRRG